MEEVIAELDIENHESASKIVDNHGAEIIAALGSDEEIPQQKGREWGSPVTYEDIAKELLLRVDAPDTVHFRSVDDGPAGGPKSKTKLGTVTDDDYNPTVKYKVKCSGCYATGKVDVTAGWNNYFECSHCGTKFSMG